MTDEDEFDVFVRYKPVFSMYEQTFGQPLQRPTLDYGHVFMSTEELARHGQNALKAGKPINWDDHYCKLPPGCNS